MSDFVQTSFLGGMNLLSEDTQLQPTQYRVGFNLRNRHSLQQIPSATLDTALPTGIIQEIVTFGEYEIAFVSGRAYYKHYDRYAWTRIEGFSMSLIAPRYWTVAVPLATTNYLRVSPVVTLDGDDGVSATSPITMMQMASVSVQGNVPGLLVQDNINQPQFIYISPEGVPEVRTTQKYEEWDVEYDTTTMVMSLDKREYVPIGNAMAWDGVTLFITGQDFISIYRSVSGRPLDFVVNVKLDGKRGGDASTVAYSVGAGNISCLKVMSDGSIFVAAGSNNFLVSKNTTGTAPLIFGEYPFVRRFLFESTCLSDRCIIDSLGDTKFIDLTGVRSFNAVLQLQNEGRNSQFTSIIQSAFEGVTQSVAAAILYDNYEFYAVNTIFGYTIAVFDTLSACWVSFDTAQTGGVGVKILAKIELGVQRLYAVTTDNKLYVLYSGDYSTAATLLTSSVNATVAQGESAVKMTNPENEVKLLEFRCVLDKITQDSAVSLKPLINNRLSKAVPELVKQITYEAPAAFYSGILNLPDVNKQLTNLYFPTPNCEQGWKTAALLSWTGGASITQISMKLRDEKPLNPMQTQGTTV